METFCMVVLGGEYVMTYCWRPGVPTRFFSLATIFVAKSYHWCGLAGVIRLDCYTGPSSLKMTNH